MLPLSSCRFDNGLLLDVQVAPDLRSLLLILEAEVPDGPQGDLERLQRTLVQMVVEGISHLSVHRRPELPHNMDEPAEMPPSPVVHLQVADALDEWERPCYELHLTTKLWRIHAVALQIVALPLSGDAEDGEDDDEDSLIS